MTDASLPQPQKGKAAVFFLRLLSTLLLWGVVAVVVYIGHPIGFFVVLGVLLVVAMREMYGMARDAGIGVFSGFGLVAGVVFSAALYYRLYQGWQDGGGVGVEAGHDMEGLGIFIVLVGAFLLQMRYAVRGETGVVAVAVTVLAFVYIAVLFNYMVRVMFIVPDNADFSRGAMMAVWLVAVTKFTDMGAYITGTLIGRHKMIPHISPGKTWQGFGGALFFALLAGVGLYALMPERLEVLKHYGHVVFLSVVLGLFAVLGDLAESLLKRGLNAKDSGGSLPGIGGALDLIDSLCFTAPVLYFYLLYVLLPLS